MSISISLDLSKNTYKSFSAKKKKYAGIMGLSIGKKEFMDKEIMEDYTKFMQDYFIHSVLIVADFPKKYNIMALEGVSEKAAEERSRIGGDNMRNMLEKITRDYPLVKVARWKDFMTKEYRNNLRVIHSGYEYHSGFQEGVRNLVEEFLHSSQNLARPRVLNPSRDMLKDYVLDELAFLLAAPLSFSLPICEIYPGKNRLQEDLQSGAFPFCKDLKISESRIFMDANYVNPLVGNCAGD